jgi:hypothetical protein
MNSKRISLLSTFRKIPSRLSASGFQPCARICLRIPKNTIIQPWTRSGSPTTRSGSPGPFRISFQTCACLLTQSQVLLVLVSPHFPRTLYLQRYLYIKPTSSSRNCILDCPRLFLVPNTFHSFAFLCHRSSRFQSHASQQSLRQRLVAHIMKYQLHLFLRVLKFTLALMFFVPSHSRQTFFLVHLHRLLHSHASVHSFLTSPACAYRKPLFTNSTTTIYKFKRIIFNFFVQLVFPCRRPPSGNGEGVCPLFPCERIHVPAGLPQRPSANDLRQQPHRHPHPLATVSQEKQSRSGHWGCGSCLCQGGYRLGQQDQNLTAGQHWTRQGQGLRPASTGGRCHVCHERLEHVHPSRPPASSHLSTDERFRLTHPPGG